MQKTVVTNGCPTSTTRYIWGNNGLAATVQMSGSGETWIVPLYDEMGDSIGFTISTDSGATWTPFTYLKNLQGDVLLVLDEDGNPVVQYTYDPWGVPTVTGDTALAALNPCSYRGYDYDEDTGYYYLQSRYYDPEIGRFLNADDPGYLGISGTITGYNIFSYCENDPINMVDATGCVAIPWEIKVGLAAGIASAIWEAVKYIKNNPTQSKKTWTFIKGLGGAAAKGFVRGFLLGVITCLSKEWAFGAIGGTISLLYEIAINSSNSKSTSVNQGISAFMNGWSAAVYSRTLSNVLSNVSRICKWSSNKSDILQYILDAILGLGIAQVLKW